MTGSDLFDGPVVLRFLGTLVPLLLIGQAIAWWRTGREIPDPLPDRAARPALLVRAGRRAGRGCGVALGLGLLASGWHEHRALWTSPLDVLVLCTGIVAAECAPLMLIAVAHRRLLDPATPKPPVSGLLFIPFLGAYPVLLGLVAAVLFRLLPTGRPLDVPLAVDAGFVVAGIGIAALFPPPLLPLLGRRVDAPPPWLLEDLARRLPERHLPAVEVRGPASGASWMPAFATYRRHRSTLVLSPRLVETYPRDETLAVALHEVGHHSLRHLRGRMRALWLAWALGVLVLGLASWATAATAAAVYLCLRAFAMPTLYQWQEGDADRFAADAMGSGAALRAALVRMHEDLNIAEPKPNEERYRSHPSLGRRVAALEAWPAPPARGRLFWAFLPRAVAALAIPAGVASFVVPRDTRGISPAFAIPIGLLLAGVVHAVERVRRARGAPAGAVEM